MKWMIALGKILLGGVAGYLIGLVVDDSGTANGLAMLAGVPFGVWAALGLMKP